MSPKSKHITIDSGSRKVRKRKPIGPGVSKLYWGDQRDGSKWRWETTKTTKDGWKVTAVLVERGGGVVVRDFRIRAENPAKPPLGGLTTVRYRDLFEKKILVAEAREHAERESRGSTRMRHDMKVLRSASGARRAPGRNVRSDEEKAAIAGRYGQLRLSSRSPSTDLAKELNMSPSRGRALVSGLQAEGWLEPPPSKGKPCGPPTRRTVELLRKTRQASA
jgi:hypothetical protein